MFNVKHSENIDSIQKNLKNVENIIHQKEKKQRFIGDSLINFIEQNDTMNFANYEFFSPEDLTKLTELGYSVLIYKNDTLFYWSDNLFDAPKKFPYELFELGCNKISNIWSDIYLTQYENYKVVTVFRIKEEYKIHNKFLEDKFQKDLNLPGNISISLIPISYGIDIKNIDGEYLLSLIPNNRFITNQSDSSLTNIFYILSLLFLTLFLYDVLKRISENNSKYLIWTIIGIIAFRVLMIIFRLPLNYYSLELFSKNLYFKNLLFLSIGDWFFNVSLMLVISFYFFKYIERFLKYKKTSTIISYILLVFASSFLIYTFQFIKQFIVFSNINLDLNNLLSLSQYSYFVILNISLSVGLVFYFIFKSVEFAEKNLSTKTIVVTILVLTLLLFGLYFVLKFGNYYLFIFELLVLAIVLFFIKKEKVNSLFFFASLVVTATIVTTIVLVDSLVTKQSETNKILIVKLANQRDDVAEVLLKEISSKLNIDQNIPDIISKKYEVSMLENDLMDYLKRNYLKSYWNKYSLKVIVCNDTTSYENCPFSKYFSKGDKKEWIVDRTYFVMQSGGKSYYLVEKKFPTNNKDSANIFLIFTPKLYPTNIGYPELLLDESVKLEKLTNYSYAKYEDNKLLYKSGSYNYPLKNKLQYSKSEPFSIITEGALKHLVYNVSKNSINILTYKRIRFVNAIILFAYLFLIFIILISFILLYKNGISEIRIKNLSFRTKITLSSLAALTFSFIIIGIITVLFNISQYERKHYNEIIRKLQEINISLSQKLTDENMQNPENLHNELRKMSDIFSLDINLYSPEGFLISTSRQEIYNLNIIGKRINEFALYKIKHESYVQFIQNEKISNLSYTSAYSLILDNDKFKAIVNVPFFSDPDELRSDISSIIISIVNIYVVLFAIALVLSIILSEQIMSPLLVLQRTFQKLELGSTYEKVDYRRKDEIGDLVREYNKMVDKLQESIDKLQKSERESAWRDMAKQIAHEIKNPLTPMKLSIQLLTKSWDNQDPDFDERLRNVTNTLITQIETLKRIAEEFSDFAKMPKPQEQVINLANKIEEICKLYENTENVEVVPDLKNYKEAIIIADEKQITRAFINLIKNAIQAMPKGVKGKIVIHLDVFAKTVIVKIEDNGSGIPDDIKDKLFIPSFTTKSSGMGLGLAMVKNIVNSVHGKISFTSEEGKGTTFTLQFPLYQKDKV